MGSIKLKDAILYLRATILISVIVFILTAFYSVLYAYGIASGILLLGLVIYIGELESIIKKYENINQEAMEKYYDKFKDSTK